MRALSIILALGLLAGCGEDGLGDQLARDQARKAVNPVLADKFPGVPLEPASNCVIDNASGGEILKLARASVAGVGPEETALIVEIATRPDTLQCLLKNGITPFL
jgi:hypothetical protein